MGNFLYNKCFFLSFNKSIFVCLFWLCGPLLHVCLLQHLTLVSDQTVHSAFCWFHLVANIFSKEVHGKQVQVPGASGCEAWLCNI